MISRLGLLCKSALTSRKGVTALEYGVIAAATIVVGMATFGAIGTDLAAIFTKVAGQL
jgi:Flp pilus assembly pilin Flp